MTLLFLENRRGLRSYWEYIKKGGPNKTETKTATKRGAEAQETKKETGKGNYNVCSSHKLIAGRYFFFALRITWPKKLLKRALHLSFGSFLVTLILPLINQHTIVIEINTDRGYESTYIY